jgi:hypothetical protein
MGRRSWNTLPPEIRCMVLEHLARSEFWDEKSLVNYAVVAKDWQPIFERLTFREIYLKSSDLDVFLRIFRPTRRSYLQYIGLTLEFVESERLVNDPPFLAQEDRFLAQMMLFLAKYNEDDLSWLTIFDGGDKDEKNGIRLTNTMALFLSILSRWNRKEVPRFGIHLEIIAGSESLWQSRAGKVPMSARPKVMRRRFHDGTVVAHTVPQDAWLPPLVAAKQDFHYLLNWNFTTTARLQPVPILTAADLPKAEVITCVSIRRRSIRKFDPGMLPTLLGCFPLVKIFNYEPRIIAEKKIADLFDTRMVDSLKTRPWPPSLSKFPSIISKTTFPSEHRRLLPF